MRESTSMILVQSGLDEQWWADAMECGCRLRNVQDLLADRKLLTCAHSLNGSLDVFNPFGAKIENHPRTATDKQTEASSIRQERVPKQLYGITAGKKLEKRDTRGRRRRITRTLSSRSKSV